MKRISIVALVMTAAVALVPLAPATAHDAPKRCGHSSGAGAGWWKLRGHDVGCTKARKVANRWENKCVWNDNCPGKPDKIGGIEPGWRCWHWNSGYESVKVRCHANEGSGIVHFFWGS